MSRFCKVCGNPLTRSAGGEHYAFCGVTGWLCRECGASLRGAIGKWAKGRSEAVAAKRLAEQAQFELVERELAEERLARVSLEALPLSTRAAMAGKRRRAA